MDVSRRDWLKGTGQLGALAAVGTDLAPVVAQAQELRIEHAKALQLGPQCRAASANSLRIISTNFCKAGALLSFLQTAENWGLTRRFVSWGGSFYARIVLGIRIRDLTGGFKCFSRPVLEALDLDAIDSRGYAFQIETTYRVVRKGFQVVEVPIRFVDRTEGQSKMSRSIVLEAVWKVPLLRLAALAGKL